MIETRDLILDKPQYDDWKSMYINLWSQDESAQYMLWRTSKTEENAKIRIEKNIAYMARHPESYLVYEKSSGEAIGFAGMERQNLFVLAVTQMWHLQNFKYHADLYIHIQKKEKIHIQEKITF